MFQKAEMFSAKKKQNIRTMPSNGRPAEEYHIKAHKPWSQETNIHLF